MLTRNHTDKITRFVSVKYQCLENLFDILTQGSGNMYTTQIVFINFIRYKFIFYLIFIQQACRIRLCYFFLLP